MAYNVNNLIKMTLQELGVQEPGQPIAAEDAELLEDYIPSVFEVLNNRDVGVFDSRNIEVADLVPLAQILAYSTYNAFNVVDPMKIQELLTKGGKNGEAERTLKDIKRLRTPRQTMRVEQYTGFRNGRQGSNSY
jgi:hypothetical protein